MTGIDAMMEFRTTYLRAIAEAWRDKSGAYLKALQKDPIKQLQTIDGYVFPWDVVLEIESVSSKESLWSPENAGGWVGRNALISIWLPPPPDDQEDWGRAWAAYYDEFPSFLGTRKAVSESTKSGKAQSGPLRESYPLGMGNWKDFLEFTAVIMRLIAVAWRDPQVRQELKQVDGKPNGVTILNKWLGYNMTWNMDVEFKLSGWDSNSPKKDKDCRWNGECWPTPRPNSCRNGLRFYIPNRPAEPASPPTIQAIALSAYNVTGDQYPFTCP